MLRLLILTSFVMLSDPLFRSMWQQESGWISTCAGMGCMGQRSVCYEYRVNGVSRYCYRGPND